MSHTRDRQKWEELACEVVLLSVPGITGRVLDGLKKRTASKMVDIWQADQRRLRQWGLTEKQVAALVRQRRLVMPVKVMEKLKKRGIQVFKRGEAGYPPLLAEVSGAPPLIFVQSETEIAQVWQRPVVAVVGSRRPTEYGLVMAQSLVSELAGAEVVIVSGLAFGIDSRAHKACIESGGVTVAVLPGGAGVISPRGNRQLAERVVTTGGVLVWEYGGEVKITKSSFPLRNRLVAGMSQAVLVVEGQQRSGSMITPTMAADYGREVLAVPGPVTSPLSEGPNNLLKQGAKVVTEVVDILEELGVTNEKKIKATTEMMSLTGRQQQVWLAYKQWGRKVDELVRESGVEVEEVLRYLTEWELTGRV